MQYVNLSCHLSAFDRSPDYGSPPLRTLLSGKPRTSLPSRHLCTNKKLLHTASHFRQVSAMSFWIEIFLNCSSETKISQVTCIKRNLRMYGRTSLMLMTLFTNLVCHGTSNQMDCVVPFSPVFWDIYDLLCDFRNLVCGVVILIKDCFTGIWQAATGRCKSTDFLWWASGGFKVALLFWILLAEAVSCGFVRVW